jgi:predicted GIY-YIG superfamily endonuclease
MLAKYTYKKGYLKIIYPNGGATYRKNLDREAIIKALNSTLEYKEALILTDQKYESKYRKELQKGYYDYAKAKKYFP